MRISRRLRLLGAAGVTVLALAGLVVGVSSAASGTVNIAFFSYNTTPYPLAGYAAAKAEAAQVGAKVTFFNSNNDPTLQATQMRDAITSGTYKAFFIWPNNAVALQPIAVQAAKAGIKVGAADATLGSTAAEATVQSEPGVTVTAGTGLKEEATVAISLIENACTAKVGLHKSCNVAIMPGLTSFPPDAYRIGIIQPALAKTGYIHTTLMPQGEYSTPGAQAATLTFFASKPKVDVLYSFADQMIAGTLTALKQLKLTPGKSLLLIGFGASTEAEAGIKAGTWYASQALYPATESRLAIKYLVEAVHGQTVPAVVDTYKLPGALPWISASVLKAHPGFKPDWSYAG
jgi:ribose transport system substrate-binding protein